MYQSGFQRGLAPVWTGVWEPISLLYLWHITVTIINTIARTELIIALLSLLDQSAKKKKKEREGNILQTKKHKHALTLVWKVIVHIP